jgi:MoxR-like ATPase
MSTFSHSLPDETATAPATTLRPRRVVALQGGPGVGKTMLAPDLRAWVDRILPFSLRCVGETWTA